MSKFENQMSLGEKIQFYRRRKNCSQLALESISGLSTGSISRIERNLINPGKESILKIADALELNNKETAHLLEINLYSKSSLNFISHQNATQI
jgi:transcriptional regulator with XRE-family HTH domain